MSVRSGRAEPGIASRPAAPRARRRGDAPWGSHRSIAAIAVATALAVSPAAARAYGLELAGLGVAGAVIPALGAEVQLGERPARTGRLVLSWPIQIPLASRDDAAISADPTRRLWSFHRLVVEPELRLVGAPELGGRLGYRFAAPRFVAGLGATYTDSLGVSASPELGVRWFGRYGIAGWYLLARAELPVTPHHRARWAGSVSVALSFY